MAGGVVDTYQVVYATTDSDRVVYSGTSPRDLNNGKYMQATGRLDLVRSGTLLITHQHLTGGFVMSCSDHIIDERFPYLFCDDEAVEFRKRKAMVIRQADRIRHFEDNS